MVNTTTTTPNSNSIGGSPDHSELRQIDGMTIVQPIFYDTNMTTRIKSEPHYVFGGFAEFAQTTRILFWDARNSLTQTHQRELLYF